MVVSEPVFSRASGWIPGVTRHDGELRLSLAAGADGLHQPREFSFPISEKHLAVIRDDLARHLLLWVAVLPLCYAAGTNGPLDEDAAAALLDPILLGPVEDVDAYFRESRAPLSTLVTHGADIRLLDRGQVVESLHSATEAADTERMHRYMANRGRTRRGVHLTPLDEAVLKYIGHYLHGSTRPSRNPDAVDPAMLPQALAVIATAEQAAAGMRISGDDGGQHAVQRKHEWRRMENEVTKVVRRRHPKLADDAIRSVSFLMCSEAAHRDKGETHEQ